MSYGIYPGRWLVAYPGRGRRAAEEIIIIIIMSVHAASLCGLFEMAGV